MVSWNASASGSMAGVGIDKANPEKIPTLRAAFRKDGGTFVCTGQLVATTQPGNDVASPTFVSAVPRTPAKRAARPPAL